MLSYRFPIFLWQESFPVTNKDFRGRYTTKQIMAVVYYDKKERYIMRTY